MADLEHNLPLLPLTSGVVLPGMVFTMALESDEARAAADAAAQAPSGQLLLVPHIDGRYARVGVDRRDRGAGELPGGVPAVVVRGERRATHRHRRPGHRRRPVGRRSSRSPRDPAAGDAIELAREYRAVLENILEPAARAASSSCSATSPSRARWPTWPATRPT